MKVELKRFVDDGNTSFGAFFIDGVFKCFMIEDEHRTIKKWGEMRIPAGVYDLSLRREGGFHNRYLNKLGPAYHNGILCVHNAPNWKIIQGDIVFQYVLIHVGNSEKDTAGCLLPNTAVNANTMRGSGSWIAYKKIYPIIRDACLRGEEVKIHVIDEI